MAKPVTLNDSVIYADGRTVGQSRARRRPSPAPDARAEAVRHFHLFVSEGLTVIAGDSIMQSHRAQHYETLIRGRT